MDIRLKNRNLLGILVCIIIIYFLSLVLTASSDLIRKREVFKKNYYFVTTVNYVILNNCAKIISNELNEKEALELGLQYYIKSRSNETIYTNIHYTGSFEDYIKGPDVIYSLKFPSQSSLKDYVMLSISQYFDDRDCEAYFIINKEAEQVLMKQEGYKLAQEKKQRLRIEAYVLIISVILASLLIIIMAKLKLRLEILQSMDRKLNKVPVDVRYFSIVLAIAFLVFFLYNIYFLSNPLGLWQLLSLTTIVALCVGYIILAVKHETGLLRNKNTLRLQWENSLSCSLMGLVRESSIIRSVFIKVTVIQLLIFACGIILGCSIISDLYFRYVENDAELLILASAAISLISYFCIISIYSLLRIRSYNRILLGTRKIVSGDLSCVIEKDKSGSLSELADNINNMRAGFKTALENEIKSERLKTELITNVSHDLKTPLTSIISYVNLLKKDGLSANEIRTFTDILEKKANRLKILIDDLFEASMMSSGAVELNIEQVDIVALLYQSMAEFEEKIAASDLTFKINASKQKINVNVDGKKMWRVFENLISNILKYSLPNTRVYIDMKEQNHKVRITFKNISNYELDFDEDEVFERFKRGDKSRHTEGSGLGLTIAKSIIELHNGKLEIEIDGDMFKAIVEINGE